MLQNVHRIEGNVTYITLTRGQEAIIDTADLERVLQVRWYAELVQRSGEHYARGKPRGGEKSTTMHRYIMEAKEGEYVDHINFNTLDNRRENLRIVTPSENCVHQRRKPGQSGMLHISVLRKMSGHQYYYVTMMRDGVHKAKSYPYTPDGLQAAQDLVTKWQEDFSYEPERTTVVRRRRANLHTATSVETGPHTTYKMPENDQKKPVLNKEDIAYIELSRGQKALIDKADTEKVAKYQWYATPNSMGGYYAVTSGPLYMHRYLLDAPNGMYVDHLNHDTLDNRRVNLRLVTNQENNVNRNGAYSTSKTGIRGVSVHKLKSSRGLMYVFRCHCVDCKIAKYFPYTEEGLEQARIFAEAHYVAMKK